MEQSFVILYGITLSEPVTFLTDMLITISCIYIYVRLRQLNENNLYARRWSLFFLYLGISTFIGGFAHLFVQYTGKSLTLFSWLVSFASVFYAEKASILTYNSNKFKSTMIYLIKSHTALLMLLAIFFIDFIYVKINSTIGIGIITLTSHIVKYTKEKNIGYIYIILGIFVAFSSSIIHTLKISISKWVTYNDIGHLLLIICLYFLYIGIKKVSLFKYLTPAMQKI